MSQFLYSDSTVVAATPEALYDLVTDIGRTGEWSPICRECWWKDGDSAAEGAWFTGRNEADGRSWETDSKVVIADRGREFRWLVGGEYVRWSYTFEAVEAGQTKLTESWEFLAAGQQMFQDSYGDGADDRIQLRRNQAIAGIPVTLAAIKRIAETS